MSDEKICVVDVDEAYSIGCEVHDGAGSDMAYFMAAQGPDGKWYATVMLDLDSCHDCGQEILTDDGPHDTYTDACFAALQVAYDWCVEQGMDVVDLDKQHDGLSQAIPLDATLV